MPILCGLETFGLSVHIALAVQLYNTNSSISLCTTTYSFPCVSCVYIAESSCKQQEAQVQLLERELEQQQSLRGPSRRRSTIPHQDSAATSSHSSRDPSTGLSSSRDQQSQSLAGELADCDESVREGKVVVEGGGGGGKEKENRVTKSPKREGRRRSVKLGAISFLEEVEREFEKKASQQAPVKNTQTALYGNRLKVYKPFSTMCHSLTVYILCRVVTVVHPCIQGALHKARKPTNVHSNDVM